MFADVKGGFGKIITCHQASVMISRAEGHDLRLAKCMCFNLTVNAKSSLFHTFF